MGVVDNVASGVAGGVVPFFAIGYSAFGALGNVQVAPCREGDVMTGPHQCKRAIMMVTPFLSRYGLQYRFAVGTGDGDQ